MKGRYFLLLALILAAASFAVPYVLLADIAGFGASYLFWCALTFLVIVAAGIYTRKWGKSA